MKIKELLAESFKSLFFNLLAIGNLVLITISFAGSSHVFIWTAISKWTVALNMPALVVARILAAQPHETLTLFPPLVYLQCDRDRFFRQIR